MATAKTAETTVPSTAEASIKWTLKVKLKAAYQVLSLIGVTGALTAEMNRERWAKTYELLVGSAAAEGLRSCARPSDFVGRG